MELRDTQKKFQYFTRISHTSKFTQEEIAMLDSINMKFCSKIHLYIAVLSENPCY